MEIQEKLNQNGRHVFQVLAFPSNQFGNQEPKVINNLSEFLIFILIRKMQIFKHGLKKNIIVIFPYLLKMQL